VRPAGQTASSAQSGLQRRSHTFHTFARIIKICTDESQIVIFIQVCGRCFLLDYGQVGTFAAGFGLLMLSARFPGSEDLPKISRYEAHLERCVYRALHELQRLQTARVGFISPTLAVDVNLAGRGLD